MRAFIPAFLRDRAPQLKLRSSAKARRAGIRRVSVKRARWNRRYSVALAARKLAQVEGSGSTYCERECCKTPGPVEGHHPQGRLNESILIFKLLCTPCHKWIHENGRAARAEGLLS